MMLKTFEQFDQDNNKVWIVGIPSGEALYIKRSDLDILYAEKLVHYNTQYVDTGFFAFKDEDVDDVKLACGIKEEPKVVTAKPKANHDIMIYQNDFDPILIDAILGMIDSIPEDIELYVQDDCLGITYGIGTTYWEAEHYIEVNMDSHGAKYHLVKRRKGKIVDEYNISTDSHLLQRIDHELSH